MDKAKNTLGMAALIYLLTVFASLIFALINLTKSAFAGLYLVVLTVPWSIVFSAALDKLGIQDEVSTILKFLAFILFAAINASVIHFITRSDKNKDRL